MNWFITTLCLIAISKGACSQDDPCKNMEPGKYPGSTCDTYVNCNGKKGSGVMGELEVCAEGQRYDKYHRECMPLDKVDCNLCTRVVKLHDDTSSPYHFFVCVGPEDISYPQRYKCNTGNYNHTTMLCGGTKGKEMDLKADAKLDDNANDRKAHNVGQ